MSCRRRTPRQLGPVTTAIGFVASLPSPPSTAIHIGALQLQAYGLFIASASSLPSGSPNGDGLTGVATRATSPALRSGWSQLDWSGPGSTT